MATDRDRAHFQSEDALRTPGRNIELGIQLSQFVFLRMGGIEAFLLRKKRNGHRDGSGVRCSTGA